MFATRVFSDLPGRWRRVLLAGIGAALLLASACGGEPAAPETAATPTAAVVAPSASPAPTVTLAPAPSPQVTAPPPTVTTAATAATPAPTTAPTSTPGLDFGDAPESGDAGYPGGPVAAAFPSSLARDGARVRTTGEDSLGPSLTQEVDASAANADASDDGVSGMLLDLATAPIAASLIAHVQIAAGAPAGPRYLNLLVDLNSDGRWGGEGDTAAPEWAVRNHQLDLTPGSAERVVLPSFDFTNGGRLPAAAWLRLVLSRTRIETPTWSGTGEFAGGEVEDYLVRLAPDVAPVLDCPAGISLAGVFLRSFTCTVTNAGGAGDITAAFTRMRNGDDDTRVLPLNDLQPGEQRDLTLLALRRDPLTPWRARVEATAEATGSVEAGVIVPLAVPAETHILPAAAAATISDALADPAGDLFHGDPSISPVRQDAAVDTAFWGAGRFTQANDTALAMPGTDGGLFDCDGPPAPDGPLVLCGSDGPAPGSHLAVWNCTTAPPPLADPTTVRTHWVMFQDGSASNDFKALPQFANDVLGDSDTQYWVAWDGGSWSLRRTSGPRLTPSATAAWAVISGECVTVIVPESEIAGGPAASVGVSSYSGPVADPFGLQATSDRAPGAQQPLVPLAQATQWTLPYALLVQRDPDTPGTTSIASDDGHARLILPDGALPDGVAANDVRVTRVDPGADGFAIEGGPPLLAYDLQPDGLVLREPATFEAVIASSGAEIPLVIHLGRDGPEFVDVTTVRLADGRQAVRTPLRSFSRWVAATEGWFSASVDDPTDHMVGESFQVTARVRQNRGVLRYTTGGYYSDEVKIVAGLIAPWQYRGTMMNPSFVSPSWLYPAPDLTTVRGVSPPPYTGTVTCKVGGRAGFIYSAGFLFTLEELRLDPSGGFRYKLRVRKATGASPFSRMFECQAPPAPPTETPGIALNLPPDVGLIRGQLFPPTTIYGIEASDPDGDLLIFTWSLSRGACGGLDSGDKLPILTEAQAAAARKTLPEGGSGINVASLAIWNHPQELCPHDAGAIHEGTVSVSISDGTNTVTRTYKGSETGIGQSP